MDSQRRLWWDWIFLAAHHGGELTNRIPKCLAVLPECLASRVLQSSTLDSSRFATIKRILVPPCLIKKRGSKKPYEARVGSVPPEGFLVALVAQILPVAAGLGVLLGVLCSPQAPGNLGYAKRPLRMPCFEFARWICVILVPNPL